MHESGLMKGLMLQILDVMSANDARRVVAVHVTLGALSNITPEHFTEHYIESAAGTAAEGARLDIRCDPDPTHSEAQHILITGVEVV